MKIVHVINYFQHQLGYQEYFLATEHSKAGHQVTVITSNKYYPFPDYDKTVKYILGDRILKPGIEKMNGFDILRLKGIFEQPPRRIYLKGLIRSLNKLKPDIVICHGIYNYNIIFLKFLKAFLKYTLIADSHDLYTVNYSGFTSLSSRITKYFYHQFIWKSKKVQWVAVSDQTKIFMQKELGINPDSIIKIPLGSDTERFKPDKEVRDKLRKEYSIKDDEVLIIYTGKLILSKDPVLILEACKDIISQYKLKFLFIGNVGEEYQERFNKYKLLLEKYIIHSPALPNSELPKYYQMSDIAVWPKEASMSAIDAMSCGLPIIIPDYLTERLRNENGIGIKECDKGELKNAIIKLSSDELLRNQMGANGRELVVNEMSWKAIARKFLNITEI